MKNTIWRKRRLKKGLDVSEVANYLDISYERYALIDKGDVKMPNKYIEKFNELINKSKGETSVNKLTREEIVNKWWDEMSTKNEKGKFKIYDIMKEFNIDTLSDLGVLLGYSRSGSISNYLTGARQIKFDTKNRIYSFFENELNIQPPKVKDDSRHKSNKNNNNNENEYKTLLSWYHSIDFAKWASDRGLDRALFKEKSGLSYGTVHSIFTGLYRSPQMKTLKKLKEFINNYDSNSSVVLTLKPVPTEEVPEDIRKIGKELVREVNENMSLKEKLLTKYEDAVELIESDIERYECIITRLEDKKAFYEQIINDINED